MLYETFVCQVSNSVGDYLSFAVGICCGESIQTPEGGALLVTGLGAYSLIVGSITIVDLLAPTEVIVGHNGARDTVLHLLSKEDGQATPEAAAAKHP